jgi:TetR/AcrR family fatty acid metabolism transcriptional regulator
MTDLRDRQRPKHQRITDAAVAVFAERGFHLARIRDIAQRAGVADGTIYLYFRNKEEILLSIFEEKMDLLLQGVHEALADVADPTEQLRAFARFHFGQVERNQAVAEVLQVELRLSNKFLKEYRPHKLWAYLGVLAAILERGKAAGCFAPHVDPFVLKWSFFGALDELAMQWVLAKPERRFDIDTAALQVADTFLRGIAISAPADLR